MPRPTVNPRTWSVGIDQRLVTVMDIPAGQSTAICADRMGNEVRVPLFWQPGKGTLPAVGENWLLSQEMGRWAFAVFIGTSQAAFPQAPGRWTALKLLGSWAAVASYHVPSYRLNANGDLQLTGRASGLTSDVIANLPAGFFSSAFQIGAPLSVASSTQGFTAGQVPRLVLGTAGSLQATGFSAPSTVTADLDSAFALSAG